MKIAKCAPIIQSFNLSFCPKCDNSFRRKFNWVRILTGHNERVEIDFPRIVYETRKKLSDKLDKFGIKYTSQR